MIDEAYEYIEDEIRHEYAKVFPLSEDFDQYVISEDYSGACKSSM